MNILYLDKEGGFGGSSRSLYFMIKSVNRSRFKPFVVFREKGKIFEAYKALGVEHTFVCRRMPVYKPSKRKNLYVLALFLGRWNHFGKSLRTLCKIVETERIDLVHMNHDSFFVYAKGLKGRTRAKIVIHMRTMLPVNIFAAWQAKKIASFADGLVFISENELDRFRKLYPGKIPPYRIIHNIVGATSEAGNACLIPSLSEGAFKVLYLGNMSHSKGADRLLRIAQECSLRGIRNTIFVVCGMDRTEKSFLHRGKSLSDSARDAGLERFFRFMGHQANPDPFLKAADVVVRVSRDNDPWGRDVIEALYYGKPVLATGSYDKFVESGVNGFLFPSFDAALVAEKLIALAKCPDEIQKMGEKNREKARRLFHGPTNAAIVEDFYRQILAGTISR